MVRRALVALALLAPLALTSGCLGSGSTEITAHFEDATGLFRGNDVGVRGVRIGEVVGVEPAGDHVKVTLRIDGDQPIPADVGALVVSRSVATDRYVELSPAYTSGPQIKSGATIPIERTRTPVEFEELLGSLEEVSEAFAGPGGEAGPLNDLLKAAAANLDGTGEELGRGLQNLSKLLTAVDGSTDDIRGNLDNLDTLTQAIAENDALVRRFTDSVATATTMLDGQKKDMEAAFDALAAMVREVAAFVKTNRANISDQIDDFVSLSEAMLEHEAEIVQLLQTAPLLTQNLQRAINDEGELVMRTRLSDLLVGTLNPVELCNQLGIDCAGLGILTDSLGPFIEQIGALIGSNLSGGLAGLTNGGGL